MPLNIQDRFGMTLSTSSAAAAECYQDGIDRLLSQNHGPELKFQEAIELDEGFACFGTEDFQIGYRAFLKKQKPEFKGK